MEVARVTVVSSDAEAEMICGLLRSEGIVCNFRKTDFGAGASGGMLSGFGPTEVLVDSSDLERARELLAASDVERGVPDTGGASKNGAV
jgi:hypothetical protein